jgi:hypothetical protein
VLIYIIINIGDYFKRRENSARRYFLVVFSHVEQLLAIKGILRSYVCRPLGSAKMYVFNLILELLPLGVVWSWNELILLWSLHNLPIFKLALLITLLSWILLLMATTSQTQRFEYIWPPFSWAFSIDQPLEIENITFISFLSIAIIASPCLTMICLALILRTLQKSLTFSDDSTVIHIE